MNDRLMRWLMRACVFLLRGAGWAAIGILVGFIVSYFFRLPGRVDVFALTETLLGVVITGLSIVGAFMVALQWSNLESKIHAFDIKVKDTSDFFDRVASDNARTAKELVERQKIFEENEEEFEKQQNELFRMLKESNEQNIEASKLIEEYRNIIEISRKEREESQEELKKITVENRAVIDSTEKLHEQLIKVIQDNKEIIAKTETQL